MRSSVLESLIIQNESKIVLLVLDGVGDIPDGDNGWRTPLEAAKTPNFDAIAPSAALGRIIPVAQGITPGSGPGHIALFGYDPIETTVGRGVLEAIGAGIELKPGDVAARANFCTLDTDGIVTDRRAGRIPSEQSAPLVERLAERISSIEDVEIVWKAGKQHRFVIVLRGPGLAGDVSDADPHKEGHPISEVEAHSPDSEKAARIVNSLITRMREVLADQPVANAALMRGLSSRPSWPGYADRFGLRAAAIAAYPMYRGVAQLAGMQVVPVGDTPADAFAKVAELWNEFDYFFIHVKATDMAGEDGDFRAKAAAVETVDAALPELLGLEPDVLCVTGDHSTPVPMAGHSWHPVPVMVRGRVCGADQSPRFHEKFARAGSLGDVQSCDLIALLLANAGRLDKYGA